MRVLSVIACAFLLAACGQAATPTTADAQTKPDTTTARSTTAPSDAAASAATDAEKSGILAAMQMRADAHGQVMNECNDRVAPQYIPVDVGLGRTILFVMVGGPNGGYSCYGDGPGLWLMRQQGSRWNEIYTSRGGSMVVLATTHNGAHDLGFGGPGMTHSTSRWTGSSYGSGPDISDDAIAQGVSLPN